MSWDSEERRQFVRVRCPCKITSPGHQKHTIFTQTENISAGGVRLITEERLKPSSIIDLDIHIKNGEFISCKGKVLWVFARKATSDIGPVVFDTGIEFYHIKDKEARAIMDLVVSIASGKK